MEDSDFTTVAQWLRQAESVLFITGAGVSADSGIGTYRGVGGLYQDKTIEGYAIEEIVSASMWRQRPELVWRYLHETACASEGAKPNLGHEVIAQLELDLPRVWVLTQNVDGLHQLAGSRNVMPIHGNVRTLRCDGCGWREETVSFAKLAEVPRCTLCNEIIRPDVVLFQETLPTDTLDTLYRELARGFDVVFSIGTSSLFPYITEPVYRASQGHGRTVEINPCRTDLSDLVGVRIQERAAVALPAIRKRWEELG